MNNDIKQGLSFERLVDWLEKNRCGFYGGCRTDEHSPQVGEFVDALYYYLDLDFGFDAKKYLKQKSRRL